MVRRAVRPARRAAAALAGLCLATSAAGAATLSLKPGQNLRALLTQAADGDVVEIPAGEYRGEVGVIGQQRLTLRGVGGRPVLNAAGNSAERKAILVVRGGDVRIENLEFRGARVDDQNGAGIRFESGRLLVLRCAFVDNENGVLTANAPDAELRVEDSDFSHAPSNTPLPHLLYAGAIGRLTVIGSRFSGGREGHLLKSRARFSEIRNNRLVDGLGGRAAYELEFPNGGQVSVVGNVIGQSAGTSNPTIVSFGAEGYGDRAQSLTFSDNTVINEAPRPATFLYLRPAAQPFERRLLNNRFFGLGEMGAADAAHGNTLAPLSALGSARP